MTPILILVLLMVALAVASLLYHRSPTTSAELLDLSAALESLEREVHRHDR